MPESPRLYKSTVFYFPLKNWLKMRKFPRLRHVTVKYSGVGRCVGGGVWGVGGWVGLEGVGEVYFLPRITELSIPRRGQTDPLSGNS